MITKHFDRTYDICLSEGTNQTLRLGLGLVWNSKLKVCKDSVCFQTYHGPATRSIGHGRTRGLSFSLFRSRLLACHETLPLKQKSLFGVTFTIRRLRKGD